MQEIEIIRGEEFKIAVRDKITENDIFIDEYRRAAKMLDEIVGASLSSEDQSDERDKDYSESRNSRRCRSKNWSWKQQDFENNIIAFCGERGEGKSSAMMTFVNAVYEMGKKNDRNDENHIFSSCQNLSEVHFAEPVLIDPSMFDDVHNVLDIVLAKIFRKFSERYEQDNQCIDETKREGLLDQFQKVYRYLSLINNQKQMLDDEFDYEGNISKLSKLGESTNLKEELSRLIREYLKVISKDKKNTQLIIAIDDLDLCSSNAYKMAEQIRKYLIIPNVVIVLSVKIDQLELCVRERNLRDFEKIYQGKEEDVYGQLNREVQTMAERYVAKLIPRQRRIYLPKVQNFNEIHIVYKEARDKEDIIWDSNEKSKKYRSFTLTMLNLIYERTGMRFLPEESGISYLLPDNLRDMVSWITMLGDLERPEVKDAEKQTDGEDNKTKSEENDKKKRTDQVYKDNILAFKKCFENQWSGDNLIIYDRSSLHVAVRKILEKVCPENNKSKNTHLNISIPDSQDSFFQVMEFFERCMKNIVDIDIKPHIYRLRTLYTIKMNSFLQDNRYDEMTSFMNGYIWGKSFSGVLPMHKESKIDRSRFELKTIDGYKAILKKMNVSLDGLEISVNRNGFKVSHIKHNDTRDDHIRAWIMLGLFSNLLNDSKEINPLSNGTLISGNNQIRGDIQISLENYLVGLCDLDMLFDKVNMEQLGIDEEKDFNRIVDVLKRENEESIRYAREIASNIDVALGIKEYCTKHRDYKENTEDDVDRTVKLVVQFFKNINGYVEQYGIEYNPEKFLKFFFGEDEKIDIADMYAELFKLSVQNEPLRKLQEGDKEVSKNVLEFRRKLTEIPKEWDAENAKEYTISPYFRNASADKVKENLENLASAVQQYNGRFKKQPEGLDVEGLCDLYRYVVDTHMKNSGQTIRKERHEEYKKLVKVKKEIKEKMNPDTSTN